MEHRESVRHSFLIGLLDDLVLELVDDILYPSRNLPFFPHATAAAAEEVRDEL